MKRRIKLHCLSCQGPLSQHDSRGHKLLKALTYTCEYVKEPWCILALLSSSSDARNSRGSGTHLLAFLGAWIGPTQGVGVCMKPQRSRATAS